MKTICNYIFSIIGLTSFISCGESAFDKEVREFVDTHMELSLDSMVYMYPLNQMITEKSNDFTYVIYVDSFTCGKCALNHFSDWDVLCSTVNAERLSYIFILSPKEGDKEQTFEIVRQDTLFNDRTYIDTTGIFEKKNPQLPENKLLHTFLINSECKVQLAGSPLYNYKMKNLLEQVLTEKEL